MSLAERADFYNWGGVKLWPKGCFESYYCSSG